MYKLGQTGVALLLCLSLAGCLDQFSKPSPETKPPQSLTQEIIEPAPGYEAEPSLNANQRFLHAVALLEQGKPGEARVELEALLKQQPSHPRAPNLIEQINTPSGIYFPEQYFDITLNYGETLSTLARQYLGDLFQFYALAKYNRIEIPAQIKRGQTIRIPLTSKSAKARQAAIQQQQQTTFEPPEEIEADVDMAVVVDEAAPVPITEQQPKPEPEIELTTAEQALSDEHQDDAQQALQHSPEPALPQTPDTVATVVEPSEQQIEPPLEPRPLMQAALARNDYSEAANHLDTLMRQQELPPELEQQAIDIFRKGAQAVEDKSPQLAARRYFDSAKIQIKRGQSEAALPSLRRSLELEANNPTASEIYTLLQKKFVDDYHRQAATAYRKQQLDRAISLWDRALEIDPNHNAAQAYRAQALELKQKLNKLQEE